MCLNCACFLLVYFTLDFFHNVSSSFRFPSSAHVDVLNSSAFHMILISCLFISIHTILISCFFCVRPSDQGSPAGHRGVGEGGSGDERPTQHHTVSQQKCESLHLVPLSLYPSAPLPLCSSVSLSLCPSVPLPFWPSFLTEAPSACMSSVWYNFLRVILLSLSYFRDSCL